MSKTMSFAQFGHLLKYIRDYNSPMMVTYPKPSVKYIHPDIDMRFNCVFAVTLRGFNFDDIVFHTQNECSQLELSLEERIRAFLESPQGQEHVPAAE